MRYIFLKRFNIKYFLPIKTFFSANNVHFVKNTNNFFFKKKKNSNLVLQQMNNHAREASQYLKFYRHFDN